jgi:hypothetical protein
MLAARGDRKPCTVPACSGTMQFGRTSLNDARRSVQSGTRAGVGPTLDPMGWICSVEPDHFKTGD